MKDKYNTLNLIKIGIALLMIVSLSFMPSGCFAESGWLDNNHLQVNLAKSALASVETLRPIEGTDTDIQEMAQKIVNKATSEVTVKVIRSNNNQINGSKIVYSNEISKGSVTFKLTSKHYTAYQSNMVIVPAKSTEPTLAPDTPATDDLVQNAYYISVSGNDSNSGTVSAPWRTIQKAANTVKAGDTVYIKGGIYNERVLLKNSGTRNNYITFSNYPGDKVIIDGTGINISFGECLFDINACNYIHIKGLTVQNSASAGIGSAVGTETSQDYSKCSYVSVEDCNTYNTGRSGIHFICANHITILRNKIKKPNTIADQEALSMARVEYFEIGYNEVVNQCKEGIDVKVGSRYGKIHDNEIHDPLYLYKDINGTRYQHNYESVYVDGWTAKTHDIEIYNNNIYDMIPSKGTSSSMVSLCCEVLQTTGTSSDPDIYNIYIHNNTAKNISNGLCLLRGSWGVDPEFKNIRFENNAVSGVVNRMLIFGSDHAHDIHIVHNKMRFKDSNTKLAHILREPAGSNAYDPNTTYFSENQISNETVLVEPFRLTTLSKLLDTNYSNNTIIGYQ